jgi:hypothetical protein
MEYKVRFNKLCKQLDEQMCELHHNTEVRKNDSKRQKEKELLDAMEKAIEKGNLMDAYRYQIILEILG